MIDKELQPDVVRCALKMIGYRLALQERGLDCDPALLREGNSRFDGGHRAARELLADPRRPTAIFATNNLMAIGLLRAIADAGLRCPDDISVVCFDDFEWVSVFPPRLTTVAQPVYEMGTSAVELLVDRLRDASISSPRQVVLAPSLVIRDSCARPHAAV